MMRPVGALATAVALVAAGSGAAGAVRPASRHPAVAVGARTLPVATAALACPAPAVGGTTTSEIAAVAAAARPSGILDGTLVVRSLSGASPTTSERRRGELLSTAVAAGSGPLVAGASGALAPDLAAAQWTRSPAGLEPVRAGTGSERGIGVTACSAAATSAWFVGGSGGVGRSTALYLTDPGSAAALVDVDVWGPRGRLGDAALHGVSVPPGGQRVLRLDALVPADRYALHVRSRTGRVTAALRTAEADGLQPLGWDWVPQADSPGRHLVVPGVLGGAGTRTLRLTAPGSQGAVVSVTVLGPQGSSQPDALAAVAVPAGRVVDLDVSHATGGAASAYRLDATAPVTAGVLAREGAAPGRGTTPGELAWTAATPTLRAGSRAVLPWVATGPGRSAAILLSAAGQGARVRLTPVGASGRTAPPARSVAVGAGETLQAPLSTGAGTAPYAVLVEVLGGSGPLVAAGALQESAADGPLVTTMPLRATVATVAVPRVVAAPGSRLR
jgi:hypothetical protein